MLSAGISAVPPATSRQQLDMWSLATVHWVHCALRQEKREERIAAKLKSINLYDSDSKSEEKEEGGDDSSM